jgi:hypothetical protein
MERAAGFTHADTGQAKLNKLDAVLALASTSKQDAALFAEMLSLPNDGRYPALELTPEQRRQKNTGSTPCAGAEFPPLGRTGRAGMAGIHPASSPCDAPPNSMLT